MALLARSAEAERARRAEPCGSRQQEVPGSSRAGKGARGRGLGRRGHARSTPLIMRIMRIFGSRLLARASTSSVTPARGRAGSGEGVMPELEVRAHCGAHRWVVGGGEEVGHLQRGALEGGSSTPIEGLGRTAPSSNLPAPNRRQVGDGPRGAHVGATKTDLREDLPPPGAHRALGGQAHG